MLCADPYYFLKFKYLDIEESELTEGQKVAHEAWVLKCVPIYTIAAAMAAHLGEAKTFKSARDQYLMMEQLYEQLVTKKPIDKSLIGYVAQLSSRSMALYSLYGPMIIRNTAKKEFLRGVLIDHIRAKKLIFEKWNENKWNQNI